MNVVLPPLNTAARRTQILDALLNHFQGVAPWKLASRKFQMWDKVGRESRPALFVVHHGEEKTWTAGEAAPPHITMEVEVYIYIWSPPNTPVPATQLEDILDKFDQSLAPSPLFGSKQTLGGFVSHCWVEGKTLLVPGDLQGDGLAIIPLRILIPS